ncbi:AGE family epimerase/isomerase [Chitinophaga sp. GCM10012297]|uniref:Cellobiose 2-epimerase n=1 Tax=Chitinophaga chungangae TaxID=2821488 RepID=A0ABS3YI60_9BACT|nr:AGE family epimerase/isomerase [Chitinophaga chungangae]MBO9153774.1 AGE family epimerase/isomerase [Chitinophaga chungangae]
MHTDLKPALQQELANVLDFWMKHTVDERSGGFYGRLANDNTPDRFALKGSVLNARILWTFAAAFNATRKPEYLETARRAYDYINAYLVDKEFGGVLWCVDYSGQPVETQKQVYAIAFTVYAFAEYFRATGLEEAKEKAIGLYSLIQLYGYDCIYGGYEEAFSRDWKLPLKPGKETEIKKSMNTHLHILEAYATLYSVWPDAGLKGHLRDLLLVFHDKIVNRDTGHLYLFFDEQWNPKDTTVSYGHDIEASWLLQQAAEMLGDETLTKKFKILSLRMADAAAEGLDADGGLWQQTDVTGQKASEKQWWPQAEAIVGFVNAYRNTDDEKYLRLAENSWNFVQSHILDKEHGEWCWGIDADKQKLEEDKVGLWKCPYHNSRACLEVIRRL